MTTLNGLPRSWDCFIQGICHRKKLVKFKRLWEECSQEEARIAAREEKMGSEDQALTVQSKSHSKTSKRRSHFQRGKSYHKRIYLESYVIHVMKHDIMQRTVLRNQRQQRRATKQDITLILQRMMNHPRREPDMKVNILQARMNIF